MSTTTTLVRDFQISLTAKQISEPPPWHEGAYAGQGWDCKLIRRGPNRSMTVKFWMGPAHVDAKGYPKKPKADEVLDCLLSDASSAGQTFEDWCGDYGYDTDSRRAYATWEAVEQQTARLKAFLGAQYEQFLYADRL